MDFEKLDKKEMMAQVEWAIRTHDPLCQVKLQDIQGKFKSHAGLELTFEGGNAVFANFEGRIVAIAWENMSDYDRYLFNKDCEDLLGKSVLEVGNIDRGYLMSLFHLLKNCDGDKRILFGDGVNFEYAMENVGINVGLYYDLSNLAEGVWAMVGNHRIAELQERAFMDSLEIKVTSHYK